AVFFEESQEITLKHLRIDPDAIKPLPLVSETGKTRSAETPFPTLSRPASTTLDQMSTTIIKKTVEQCGGKNSKTAPKIGISRSRIYRALRETGADYRMA